MPAISFRLPRFLRRHRSRSRSPKPSLPRHDYAAASSSGPSASPALSSKTAAPERHADVSASTARSSTSGHVVDPQSADLPFVNGAPDDFGGQLGNSNVAQIATIPRSIAQQSAYLPCSPNHPEFSQSQQSLYKHTGMFNQARDLTVTGGTFVDSSVTYNNVSSNQFMKELLKETIPGAEFDSSDRDPPPRCHPGTRLAVLERCLYFISNCDGVKKMRWVVGAAGVGKSAIMQSVAESPELPVSSHASVFFSINGRDDGTKAIITLSYQFAAKSDSYRQVIEQEITRDPSLLRSSMAKQFKKLIVEPFIHNTQLKSAGRVLVIIDGLDECKDHRTQQELLRLVSDLCLTYPSSPLVWLIASRPESHITSFFSKHKVIPACEKDEIPIEANEARADVERFLREKLTEIKESDLLNPRWPEEQDFRKLADAAGGLFAYAQTLIRYIGDSRIGSPVSQLSDVLHVIDNHPMADISREEHPMALLDALYERILSNVPDKIMTNTRKLLLALASRCVSRFKQTFATLCNWLGITVDEAYAAVNHLRSVLYVPRRDEAHEHALKAFHKSFTDYISDFSRSKFSPDIEDEAFQINTPCIFRILNEVPDGLFLSSHRKRNTYGWVRIPGPLRLAKISLSWLVGQANGQYGYDDVVRLSMYYRTIHEIADGMSSGDSTFQSESCIRFLTSVFCSYDSKFPHYQLLNVVFDESRRSEIMIHGILRQMPLEAFTAFKLTDYRDIKLQFRRPATLVTTLSDSWNPLCEHKREGEWKVGEAHYWTTTFRSIVDQFHFPGICCSLCSRRLEFHLKNWTTRSPDKTALVLFTSTDRCCVQVRLVDPEDGVSEWTYWFWCDIPQEEREKYGSTV